MGFDLELVMSGLGAIWLRSPTPRNPKPSGVDFLMVDCCHGHAHVPRLDFRFEDLASPEGVELPAHVGADGATLASFDLAGKTVELTAQGQAADFDVVWCEDESATRPGEGAPRDAMDWLPNFADQLGLDDVVGPDGESAATVYAARVSLPAGRLSSWKLFPADGAASPDDVQMWSFGSTPPRVLAEYGVLVREGLERLVVRIDGQDLVFDDQAIRRSGGAGVLRLALTNLPPVGRTGRFLSPDHFPMYRSINQPPQDPWPVRRADGAPEPATSGVACPPGNSHGGG
jgi:hypothetical protein